MKNLLLILALLFPALASAEGHTVLGERICRDEVGSDPMARQHCLRDFQKSAYLVHRYYTHAGVLDEAGDPTGLSFSHIFRNPFVLSPRRVIDQCMAGQLYNGNMFSGMMDLREVWDCIAEIDPEAALWDMI